jgi:lipopolysaccharide biosynthesis glycosyltransferase
MQLAMSTSGAEITVAFVYLTDERGFELARHSAMSLAMSQRAPCSIHIFCYRFVPDPSSQFLQAMANLRASVVFHEISDPAVEHHQTCLHVTTPTLLKPAAVTRLVGQYDRIVYLDSDVLVFEDLMIEDIDFGSMPMAAVVDMDLTETGALHRSGRTSDNGETEVLGSYFNAGFMVFESKNWRSGEFLAQYAAALDQHNIECKYKSNCTSIDQCAMNSVFERNWVRLPMSHNLQAGAKFTRAWKTATVRHYAGGRKFIPVALFRNDSKDVRYLNRIRQAMGMPTTPFPFLFELPYRLNAARKYRNDVPMRG